MTANIDLGDNYNVDEDSNGDFVITHGTNGDLLKYDASADRITILKADEKIQDVVDALLVGGTNVSLTYDDAGNSLTIDATDTDTTTDVSDGGTTVVSETTDINFGTDLSVTDDGDGTVTVDASGSTTDTRTDVSDSGSLVVSDVEDINFDANITVTDDADGSVTVDASSSTDTTTGVSDGGVEVLAQTDDINFTESGAATVNVTDDGDGTATVNVDATDTDTDTRVDVSDDGTLTLSEPTDINFSTNLTVSDDGDGTVTVDASGTGTDTRTDVSEAGTTVVSDTTDINFTNSGDATVNVTDDGDGSVTVDVSSTDTDTDTRTDISDNGSLVVSDTEDINFRSAIVLDDTDGTVEVNTTDYYHPKSFPRVELEDGESVEYDIPVDDGETLNLWRFGAHRTSDNTAPTGLTIEFLDGSDTVIDSSNGIATGGTNTPTSTLSNSTGSLTMFTVRILNSTGATEEVSGHFAYNIE